MANNENNMYDWNGEQGIDGSILLQTDQPRSNETGQDAIMSQDGQLDGHMWQPTAEELAAAAAFDQANADDQTDVPQVTTEQLLQQALDHEMALQLDAMNNGAAYAINLPWDDRAVPPETFECACGDTFTHAQMQEGLAIMITCNNSHVRCKDCLNENVRVGLSSRLNYPPKCCGPFDIADIFEYLEEDVRAEWFEKWEEYQDVAPVYCAAKECSQYLAKEKLIEDGKWALCDTCIVKTCTGCLCLESAHEEGSAECPERIDKMDKDLMTKAGWKPCPRCGNMIERTEGCDHMTCECSQEFCYTCGRPLDGVMPCNCNGQRDWVEEDDDANDIRTQQQILADIARAQRNIGEEEDTDSDVGNDDSEAEGDGVVEGDTHGTEDATNDQNSISSIINTDTNQAFTNRQAITTAIRTLHQTEPQLAIRMDLLSQVQVRPYTLPEFAADVRRVRDMTGEAFNEEMNNLENAMEEAIPVQTQPAVRAQDATMQEQQVVVTDA